MTVVLRFAAGCSAGLLWLSTIAALQADEVLAETPVALRSDAAADHAIVQSMLRMERGELSDFSQHRDAVARYLQSLRAEDPAEFVEIARKLGADGLEPLLMDVAADPGAGSASASAAKLLMRSGGRDDLAQRLQSAEGDLQLHWIETIAAIDSEPAAQMVVAIAVDQDQRPVVRMAAANALGKNWQGEQQLLELARQDRVDDVIRFEVSNALLGSWSKDVKAEAQTLSSLAQPETKEAQPLPPINDLVRMSGRVAPGREVFFGIGTCANCHQVDDKGKNVGPNLSEIGSKLSKEDMYSAILNPSAAISHNYETYTALTDEGAVYTGLLVGQNDATVTIRTAEGIDQTVPRVQLEQLKKQDVSLMPAGLQKVMSVQQLVDLVDYLTMLKKPDEKRFNAAANASNGEPSREASDAISGFDIAEGLTVQLFAHEPQMFSPTAIDVDPQGRIWVCEAVNYRHFRNQDNEPRTEGDRILVMSDTDGDAVVDQTTVFYQGRDIDSPHGVCFLGDSVLASARDQVLRLRDTDDDGVADEKVALFTGIGGVDHDHGIHSFMPGPDGKLYFNFGNEGKQILDRDGRPIVDKAGNTIRDDRQPYQQGMVFRCEPDGSEMETLGWNFRNNWEVAVDSFGAMWQSDNDDDGNRGTRINFVMEYGNYGYRDENTGDQWRTERINLEPEVPLQHWHLNDPGVVPNLLQTGAGSPTGMMIYEGDLLPERFHGQMIHTDPGPNVVRSYPTRRVGAGYSATIEPMVQGVEDQWFRPVDAVAAPDGSVFVADWYDPGVGGHRMGDIERGRLFRITTESALRYEPPRNDVSTVQGAIRALESPNVATRFLAHMALRRFFSDTAPSVDDFIGEPADPRIRARRMWVLAKVATTAVDAVHRGLADEDLNVRLAAIRAARQVDQIDLPSLVRSLVSDPSPQVRRELLIAIREIDDDREVADLWTALALQYKGGDRWYLEALGIAADNRWDTMLPVYLERVGDDRMDVGVRDVIWRAKTPMAIDPILEFIREANTPQEQARYFRALDFQPKKQVQAALRGFLTRG